MPEPRKASVGEIEAVATLVKGLRPNWANVVDQYVDRNAALMDVVTFTRRAIGAACDPTVKLPSDMMTWEFTEPETVVTAAAQLPAAIPVETWRSAVRCGHGALLNECALCRRRTPPDRAPVKGLGRPTNPAPYVEEARRALAHVSPPAPVPAQPE